MHFHVLFNKYHEFHMKTIYFGLNSNSIIPIVVSTR